MPYYFISVPLNLENKLIYKYSHSLSKGIRVIVSVGRNLVTGIVIKECDLENLSSTVSYKSILEIVDDKPVMSENMIKLAEWMSNYYKTALGVIIDTMLPLAMKHNVSQKVRLVNALTKYPFNDDCLKKKTQYVPDSENHVDVHAKIYCEAELEILNILHDYDTQPISKYTLDPLINHKNSINKDTTNTKMKQMYSNWIQISDLREQVKSRDFYKIIEKLEKEKVIEVYRTFDEKIKPKYATFVKVLPVNASNIDSLKKLTDKQQEAYNIILDRNGDIGGNHLDIKKYQEFALSKISSKISYAIIKALKIKKLIDVYPKKVEPTLFEYIEKKEPKKIEYNAEQIAAISKIKNIISKQTFKTFLLYGVTGSGKTEVYIEVIKECLRYGKTAIIQVPEISLTPQTIQRFYNIFGDDIAILHSGLNDRERYFQWKMISNGSIKIVIGVRSAVFAPISNIGVIIVDEEHESSYKQDHHPCYNGRDIAVMRGAIEKAVVILGSATPSLESWANSLNSKYELLTIEERPGNAVLPYVTIIDMKNEEKDSYFSNELKAKIQDRLTNNEQIILFHNRRGYTNFIQCVNCGKLYKCQNCDISLTYHKNDNKMICHYCGFFEIVPRKCTDCGGYHFLFGSPGTEQLESQIKILFPSAKVLRMDSDTTKKKESYNDMFEAMRNQHIDILLGTQMISKGLDFPNVTLVGVILAEITLNLPDFRSAEKTFQLLTQVAGRSGRGDKKGEVIIQTRNPDHYALICASKQDFLSFSYKEMLIRAELFYPPKYKLCRIIFSCTDLDFLKEKLVNSQFLLLKLRNDFPQDEFLLLPFIEAPLSKINNKYRYHLILKSAKSTYIQVFLDNFIKEFQCPKKINMTIDIDPISLM